MRKLVLIVIDGLTPALLERGLESGQAVECFVLKGVLCSRVFAELT